MSATTKQSAIPPDMQWRARNIAMQASKLAAQAAPTTRTVVVTARQRADGAAEWARPWVIRTRVWMAGRAARGSVLVEERIAPEVVSMLTTAAEKLEPPKSRTRRWPKVLAGISMLAAGGAAAASAAIRNRQGTMPIPMTPPAGGPGAQPPSVLNPSAEGEPAFADTDINGVPPTS